MKNKIIEYEVNADQFFSNVPSTELCPYHSCLERCEKSINLLCERYRLVSGRLLSIGTSQGFEEYWFYKRGFKVILNDLDLPEKAAESEGLIEQYLKTLGSDSNERTNLQYYVGDANELIYGNYLKANFDCLYVSSFHPDEVRRENIQNKYRLRRKKNDELNYITWPRLEKPYLPLMLDATKYLKPTGLTIFQHYKGGVDIRYNHHYLDAVDSQFRDHGMILLEAYCFESSPQNLLVVGFKGSIEEAITFRNSLSESYQITEFHGRYPDRSVRTQVRKVFDLVNKDTQSSFQVSHVKPSTISESIANLYERKKRAAKSGARKLIQFLR